MIDSISLIIGITSLILSIAFYVYQNKDSSRRLKVKFLDKSSGQNAFYNYFPAAIRKAKVEVVQYAEGFNTEEGRMQNARNYVEGIRQSLRDNTSLRWTRYQMKSPEDKGWMGLMDELKDEFPSRFNQVIVNNQLGDHLMSMILIDPDTKNSKIFFLLSKPEVVSENTEANIATSSLVISNAKKFSEELKDQFKETYKNLKNR